MSALRKGAGEGCLNTTDWQGGTADLDIVVESLATTFTFYHIHLCLHRRVFECGFKTNNNDMSVRFSFVYFCAAILLLLELTIMISFCFLI